MSKFKASVNKVFDHEGGYVDHPNDAGGATNMGITMAVLRKWRGSPIAKADVREMKREEAEAIYKSWYWDLVRGDELPWGVGHVAFDAAVNSGGSQSIKWLQRAVGVKDDGILGPRTMAALQTVDAGKLIDKALDLRLATMRTMRNRNTGALLWPSFGKGWTSRIARVRAEAHAFRRDHR